ncbi:MAG: lipid-A-disaccharide synthase [Candidatus Marinimicrobia bacterium]|nr:lipid-A-disaccharide synthase [Candidatus Neomarinimicrobiota bacterium]
MSNQKIFISAGELSGDMHGGNLIRALLQLNNRLDITAIGGDNIKQAGGSLLYHIDETSFMGTAEIIKHLPKIYKIWRNTKKHLKFNRPDLIILIDYPGFNLRLAKYAAKLAIPVVYYISPKIWAWNESRIKKIKKYVDQMLCILPFEEEWYRERDVQAKFVGNPLIDQYQPISSPQPVKQEVKTPKIGLFPGSRAQEIQSLLPGIIEAMRKIRKYYKNFQATVAMAPGYNFSNYRNHTTESWIHWEEGQNKRILEKSDALIMASGTAVLEATILNTPTIVVYKVSPLTYLIGKMLIKVDYISLTNIIAGEEIVPELIQQEANPDHIANELIELLESKSRRKRMKKRMAEITQKLGKKGVAKRTASIINNNYLQK